MTKEVWLGPNGGYGEVVRDDSTAVWNWPHRSFAGDNLTPVGKQSTKEGTEPIYDFKEYWAETPQQKAWELVASIVGVDSEDPQFNNDVERTIATKLTTAACALFTIKPERDGLVCPEPAIIESLLTEALVSGDPVGHLDGLAARAAIETEV